MSVVGHQTLGISDVSPTVHLICQITSIAATTGWVSLEESCSFPLASATSSYKLALPQWITLTFKFFWCMAVTKLQAAAGWLKFSIWRFFASVSIILNVSQFDQPLIIRPQFSSECSKRCVSTVRGCWNKDDSSVSLLLPGSNNLSLP